MGGEGPFSVLGGTRQNGGLTVFTGAEIMRLVESSAWRNQIVKTGREENLKQ